MPRPVLRTTEGQREAQAETRGAARAHLYHLSRLLKLQPKVAQLGDHRQRDDWYHIGTNRGKKQGLRRRCRRNAGILKRCNGEVSNRGDIMATH